MTKRKWMATLMLVLLTVYINLAQTPANYDRSGSRVLEPGLCGKLSCSKLKR